MANLIRKGISELAELIRDEELRLNAANGGIIDKPLLDFFLEKGTLYAKRLASQASGTSLAGSINYEISQGDKNVGYIYSNAYSYTSKYNSSSGNTTFTKVPYLKFVEFGTGIVGATSGDTAHAPTEWEYDVNNHGHKGWVYQLKTLTGVRQFRFTKGMLPRPIMFQTLQYLNALVSMYGLSGKVKIEYKYEDSRWV